MLSQDVKVGCIERPGHTSLQDQILSSVCLLKIENKLTCLVKLVNYGLNLCSHINTDKDLTLLNSILELN